jgi:hypothetical protein
MGARERLQVSTKAADGVNETPDLLDERLYDHDGCGHRRAIGGRRYCVADHGDPLLVEGSPLGAIGVEKCE